MPNIIDHHSKQCTKLIAIGNSGAGKTGALASLAAAGYNLRIIDLDNGVDILHHYLTDANSPYVKANPQIAQHVDYITITDHMMFYPGAGKIAPKTATVWRRVMDTCKEWPGFGPIVTWGPTDILVIDSLSKLAEAALFFHLDLNNALGKDRNAREFQRDIGSAQALVMGFLSMLYEDEVKCNIIVNSHVKMTTAIGETANREKNQELIGFPNAIGSAICPMIPRFFNSQLVFKELGVGQSARRMIYTVPTMISDHIVTGKASAPLKVAESYPISNGLADYFKAVRS